MIPGIQAECQADMLMAGGGGYIILGQRADSWFKNWIRLGQ